MPGALVTISDWSVRFPSKHMDVGTFWHPPQNGDDTNSNWRLVVFYVELGWVNDLGLRQQLNEGFGKCMDLNKDLRSDISECN